jgi:hypothetical protein
MYNTVFCLAPTEPQANTILVHLRNLGFSAADISVVLPKRSDTKNISMEEDAIRGAETGGLVGGILGWLAGLSALTIPGIGAFLVAGPLVSALGGAVAGGVVGGLAGGSGAVHPLLGLPHDVTRRVEDRLRAGDILISVHSDDPVIRERAVRAFKASGAEDIYYPDEEAAA